MAVGTWKIYAAAKRRIGNGGIKLGTGVFKMSLHKSAASTIINKLSTVVGFVSVANEISARGGYLAGGRNLVPATGQWTTGTSTKQMKFTQTTLGLVYTASGSTLGSIKFALIHYSTAAASGYVLCFASLSSAMFTISSPNTLTILPAATGIFTLA